jgi:broad specificity phosphatase PhoE
MAIFLIRHGETDHNARRVVQPPGAELSRRGLEQARRLARRLEQSGVERILASDLERARATAEEIARLTGAPLALDSDLQERNYGEIRGTPYDELRIDIFEPGYAPPGGEDGPTFDRRVDSAWARVVQESGEVRGNLAVVTHGLVCASIARRYLTLAADGAPLPERWGNASLTIIEPRPPWTVTRLNCCAHLDSETREDPLAPSGR